MRQKTETDTPHFWGSKYILSDGGGFTSKQLTWSAKELGFIKVYTSLIP